MTPLERRLLFWIGFVCVVIGLYIQVPRLIERGFPTWAQVRAADAKAQAAWSHLYGVQTDRVIASIDAADHGDKLPGGWR